MILHKNVRNLDQSALDSVKSIYDITPVLDKQKVSHQGLRRSRGGYYILSLKYPLLNTRVSKTVDNATIDVSLNN